MHTALIPTSEELKAINSIYPVSRETIARLTHYRFLLQKWQEKTNLVAPNTMRDFWRRHVADSLQVLAIAQDERRWCDLGSGGGFPGMVTAIVLAEKETTRSEMWVRLVESNRKKCAFLRQVGHETEALSSIVCERIESVPEYLCDADVITARALAPLSKLLEWIAPAFEIKGDTRKCRALFHKGREYRAEIEECRGKWSFDLIVHEGKLDADSVVLEISSVTAV